MEDMKLLLSLLLLSGTLYYADSFLAGQKTARNYGALYMKASSNDGRSCRRRFLSGILAAGVVGVGTNPSNAVERAVGGAEIACRERGDCLETGEWDGAVGWNWGARDRCDPSDPRCGTNGILMDAPPSGEPVPTLTNKVTHEVTLSLAIGRAESGTLRLGLFGEVTPKSVQQLVDFLSPSGFSATSRSSLFDDGIGLVSAPLSMSTGYGLLTMIVPSKSLAFGIPSQAAAFAKGRGSSKAGDNFTPQPRPKEQLKGEATTRAHDVAGLVSIPGAGLGYATNGPEDEAYANAFQITAGPAPSMDREGRKVVGQVLDQDSMAFLARLATLPTKKGIKGVLPGQNSGPPLLKITVIGATVTPRTQQVEPS
mmetsp:Transcript_9570/g.15984  ORF Transcript_9570/g.15984 Transcript_9570/m.15984 type:complete len:368 (-) Transcript_9570:1342-2445(-)